MNLKLRGKISKGISVLAVVTMVSSMVLPFTTTKVSADADNRSTGVNVSSSSGRTDTPLSELYPLGGYKVSLVVIPKDYYYGKTGDEEIEPYFNNKTPLGLTGSKKLPLLSIADSKAITINGDTLSNSVYGIGSIYWTVASRAEDSRYTTNELGIKTDSGGRVSFGSFDDCRNSMSGRIITREKVAKAVGSLKSKMAKSYKNSVSGAVGKDALIDAVYKAFTISENGDVTFDILQGECEDAESLLGMYSKKIENGEVLDFTDAEKDKVASNNAVLCTVLKLMQSSYSGSEVGDKLKKLYTQLETTGSFTDNDVILVVEPMIEARISTNGLWMITPNNYKTLCKLDIAENKQSKITEYLNGEGATLTDIAENDSDLSGKLVNSYKIQFTGYSRFRKWILGYKANLKSGGSVISGTVEKNKTFETSLGKLQNGLFDVRESMATKALYTGPVKDAEGLTTKVGTAKETINITNSYKWGWGCFSSADLNGTQQTNTDLITSLLTSYTGESAVTVDREYLGRYNDYTEGNLSETIMSIATHFGKGENITDESILNMFRGEGNYDDGEGFSIESTKLSDIRNSVDNAYGVKSKNESYSEAAFIEFCRAEILYGVQENIIARLTLVCAENNKSTVQDVSNSKLSSVSSYLKSQLEVAESDSNTSAGNLSSVLEPNYSRIYKNDSLNSLSVVGSKVLNTLTGFTYEEVAPVASKVADDVESSSKAVDTFEEVDKLLGVLVEMSAAVTFTTEAEYIGDKLVKKTDKPEMVSETKGITSAVLKDINNLVSDYLGDCISYLAVTADEVGVAESKMNKEWVYRVLNYLNIIEDIRVNDGGVRVTSSGSTFYKFDVEYESFGADFSDVYTQIVSAGDTVVINGTTKAKKGEFGTVALDLINRGSLALSGQGGLKADFLTVNTGHDLSYSLNAGSIYIKVDPNTLLTQVMNILCTSSVTKTTDIALNVSENTSINLGTEKHPILSYELGLTVSKEAGKDGAGIKEAGKDGAGIKEGIGKSVNSTLNGVMNGYLDLGLWEGSVFTSVTDYTESLVGNKAKMSYKGDRGYSSTMLTPASKLDVIVVEVPYKDYIGGASLDFNNYRATTKVLKNAFSINSGVDVNIGRDALNGIVGVSNIQSVAVLPFDSTGKNELSDGVDKSKTANVNVGAMGNDGKNDTAVFNSIINAKADGIINTQFKGRLDLTTKAGKGEVQIAKQANLRYAAGAGFETYNVGLSKLEEITGQTPTIVIVKVVKPVDIIKVVVATDKAGLEHVTISKTTHMILGKDAKLKLDTEVKTRSIVKDNNTEEINCPFTSWSYSNSMLDVTDAGNIYGMLMGGDSYADLDNLEGIKSIYATQATNGDKIKIGLRSNVNGLASSTVYETGIETMKFRDNGNKGTVKLGGAGGTLVLIYRNKDISVNLVPVLVSKDVNGVETITTESADDITSEISKADFTLADKENYEFCEYIVTTKTGFTHSKMVAGTKGKDLKLLDEGNADSGVTEWSILAEGKTGDKVVGKLDSTATVYALYYSTLDASTTPAPASSSGNYNLQEYEITKGYVKGLETGGIWSDSYKAFVQHGMDYPANTYKDKKSGWFNGMNGLAVGESNRDYVYSIKNKFSEGDDSFTGGDTNTVLVKGPFKGSRYDLNGGGNNFKQNVKINQNLTETNKDNLSDANSTGTESKEMKPDYTFSIWRGNDKPTLANYVRENAGAISEFSGILGSGKSNENAREVDGASSKTYTLKSSFIDNGSVLSDKALMMYRDINGGHALANQKMGTLSNTGNLKTIDDATIKSASLKVTHTNSGPIENAAKDKSTTDVTYKLDNLGVNKDIKSGHIVAYFNKTTTKTVTTVFSDTKKADNVETKVTVEKDIAMELEVKDTHTIKNKIGAVGDDELGKTDAKIRNTVKGFNSNISLLDMADGTEVNVKASKSVSGTDKGIDITIDYEASYTLGKISFKYPASYPDANYIEAQRIKKVGDVYEVQRDYRGYTSLLQDGGIGGGAYAIPWNTDKNLSTSKFYKSYTVAQNRNGAADSVEIDLKGVLDRRINTDTLSMNVSVGSYTGSKNKGNVEVSPRGESFSINGTVFNSSQPQIVKSSTYKFYPNVKMTYQTLSGNNVGEVQYAYALAKDESSIESWDYVEVGYNKNSVETLALKSTQWSTHVRSIQAAGKDRVLPGGAIFKLVTKASDGNDNVKVGIKTWQIYSDNSAAFTDSGKNLTSAEGNFNSLVASVTDGLNSLDVHLKVLPGMLGGDEYKDYADLLQSSVYYSGNTNAINTPASGDETYPIRTSGDQEKYVLKTVTDKLSKGANEADLDVKNNIYTRDVKYSVWSTTDGVVHVTDSLGNSQNLGLTENASALSDKFQEMEAKTNAVSNFIASIDRNQGMVGVDGIPWYNEAHPGIKVLMSESVISVGFHSTSARTAALDVLLTGKLDNKADLYNFDDATSIDKVRSAMFCTSDVSNVIDLAAYNVAHPSGSAVNSIAETTWGSGTLDIKMSNLNQMYMSKIFYIPNATVNDLTN